jgi:hypothetical protein
MGIVIDVRANLEKLLKQGGWIKNEEKKLKKAHVLNVTYW